MTAAKADAVFNEVRFQCRPGVIVNAGPPLGLLENAASPNYGGGADRPEDEYAASSDALCDRTAECVNEEAGATHYPAATVESCKAMFANAWSFVDVTCVEDAAARDAAKALYDCRAASCDIALGGDDVCTMEEDAFRAAQEVYGACLAAR